MTTKRLPFVLWWGVLLWAGLIFATSCTVISTDQLFRLVGFVVGPTLLKRFELFRGVAWFAVVKSWHAAEFGILTAGLIVALGTWKPPLRPSHILLAAAIAILFAASDEFHQTFVPTRGGTIPHVLIDSLGVGAVTLFFLRRLRLPRLPATEKKNPGGTPQQQPIHKDSALR